MTDADKGRVGARLRQQAPTLDDLFVLSGTAASFPILATDPFRSQDVLLGTQILEVRYDGVRSALAVLLEMRVADHDWPGSAGLLVATEVSDFSWSQEARRGMRTAWTVLGSAPQLGSEGLAFRCVGSPAFSLKFTARRASFYAGCIDELEEVPPPDYTEPDWVAVRAGIPHWDSVARNVKVVHFP